MSEQSGRGQGQQTSARVIGQPDREEGILRPGDAPIEHERPEDWGWHHAMGKGGRILLVFPIVYLLAMMFGNHEGNVENIFLVCFAAGIVVILLWDMRRRKNAWRSR